MQQSHAGARDVTDDAPPIKATRERLGPRARDVPFGAARQCTSVNVRCAVMYADRVRDIDRYALASLVRARGSTGAYVTTAWATGPSGTEAEWIATSTTERRLLY